MAKNVYFVRHGQTNDKSTGIYNGIHAMLTDEGRAQAEMVAKRVRDIGIDALVASTFTRALDTAEPMARETGLVVEPSGLFIEAESPSETFGKPMDDPKMQEIVETVHTAPDPSFRYSDEETFAEFTDRARKALTFLEEHPAENIGVVTHSIFSRALMHAAVLDNKLPKELFWHMRKNMPIGNASITHMQYLPEHKQWKLVTWNDQAHLG